MNLRVVGVELERLQVAALCLMNFPQLLHHHAQIKPRSIGLGVQRQSFAVALCAGFVVQQLKFNSGQIEPRRCMVGRRGEHLGQLLTGFLEAMGLEKK